MHEVTLNFYFHFPLFTQLPPVHATINGRGGNIQGNSIGILLFKHNHLLIAAKIVQAIDPLRKKNKRIFRNYVEPETWAQTSPIRN